MKPLYMSPALPTERVKRIEGIIRKLSYYAWRVDSTCLVPLITMATINDLTEQDVKNAHQCLDYMAT